ncbi:conserved hypothetical protein [Ricinus communis]|uniref:Uncharacterized protein n=1 Tax=Ricinus communis TaxID=3988 RepID=B9RVT8_RICCO|nr:conserved hypothetical protein [Ricinus communis]
MATNSLPLNFSSKKAETKNFPSIYNNKNNTPIAIFVPQDNALRIELRPKPDCQIQFVTSKVDNKPYTSLIVTEIPKTGYPSINSVKIKDWNIYNDGKILVHGVEDSFKLSRLRAPKVQNVEKIARAPWNAGYKTMGMIIEFELRQLIPYGGRIESRGDGRSMLLLYNNNTITVFAPPDTAIRRDDWIKLEYQVVTSKVDKQSFDSGSLSNGSVLLTSHCDGDRL